MRQEQSESSRFENRIFFEENLKFSKKKQEISSKKIRAKLVKVYLRMICSIF